MEAWALGFGPVERWGIEGASGLGRHTSIYLAERGHDVRDCSPNRTNERRRARQQGKTDASDSLRIARETQAERHAPGVQAGRRRRRPRRDGRAVGLWHKARRSVLKSRQHILNEAENLLCDLPLELRELLPATTDVKSRLAAVARRTGRATGRPHPPAPATAGRVRQRGGPARRQGKGGRKELARLTKAAGSTLDGLCGISTRS